MFKEALEVAQIELPYSIPNAVIWLTALQEYLIVGAKNCHSNFVKGRLFLK